MMMMRVFGGLNMGKQVRGKQPWHAVKHKPDGRYRQNNPRREQSKQPSKSWNMQVQANRDENRGDVFFHRSMHRRHRQDR